MIFYFSATGNSKYVAHRIATKTNDKIVDISECIKMQNFVFDVETEEKIGIVSPTYFWGLPVIVIEFLQKLELKTPLPEKLYIYHIATYGTTVGQAGNITKKLLYKKGLSMNAKFSVQMPDTWTPMFNLTDKEKIQNINLKAEKQITDTIKRIEKGLLGDYCKHKIPKFAVDLYYPTYEKKRKTKNFTVEDTCIGCKLCEKKCPVGAIQVLENRPIWIKDKCVLCLGCLHHCPKFSIQYGKNTKKHGQYLNPNIKT